MHRRAHREKTLPPALAADPLPAAGSIPAHIEADTKKVAAVRPAKRQTTESKKGSSGQQAKESSSGYPRHFESRVLIMPLKQGKSRTLHRLRDCSAFSVWIISTTIIEVFVCRRPLRSIVNASCAPGVMSTPRRITPVCLRVHLQLKESRDRSWMTEAVVHLGFKKTTTGLPNVQRTARKHPCFLKGGGHLPSLERERMWRCHLHCAHVLLHHGWPCV